MRRINIFLGIAAALLTIYIGVAAWHIISHRDFIAAKGQFGDAFNGIIGPAVALFAAVLVYLSFRQQIRANELIQEQRIFDLQHRLLEGVKSGIEKVEIKHSNTLQWYKGMTAIEMLGSGWGKLQNVENALRNLNNIIVQLNYLIVAVDETEYSNKDYLSFEIDLYVDVELLPQLEAVLLQVQKEGDVFPLVKPAFVATIVRLRTLMQSRTPSSLILRRQ